jgi:nucleoside phosphorylase
LSPDYSIGKVVLYRRCIYSDLQVADDRFPQSPRLDADASPNTSPFLREARGVTEAKRGDELNTSKPLEQSCDPELTDWVHRKLKERVVTGVGLTSDRLIYSATEKRHLGQLYGADVVDMEGFSALEVLSRAGVAVAMLRVISDDCHHNIPNLTSAISPEGSLQPLPLAIALLRQPIAATRLISGSLGSLQVLQDVTAFLFNIKPGCTITKQL